MAEMIDIETIQDPTLRQQILAAKAKLGGAPVVGMPGMKTSPVAEEGMQAFHDQPEASNVIPFPRGH